MRHQSFSAVSMALIGLMLSALSHPGSAMEEDYMRWSIQADRFPSTGGNGVVIGEYRPVVIADRCVTAFTATTPDGTVYRNIVMFDAAPVQGGILCNNGRWSAQDGSASGTTPYRVFIKDGVLRGSP